MGKSKPAFGMKFGGFDSFFPEQIAALKESEGKLIKTKVDVSKSVKSVFDTAIQNIENQAVD
jgi:hypothetical protein